VEGAAWRSRGERRNLSVRACRDRVARWLDVHPRELGRIPPEAIGALAAMVETAREAVPEVVAHLREENAQLSYAVNLYQELARKDVLTNLPNRRGLEETLALEVDRARRHGRVLSVLLADVDMLKRVNDTHGHLAGDALLREVATRLLEAVRSTDIVGRLGGDEFLVICPDTSAQAASVLAERLLRSVCSASVRAGAVQVEPSISIGWSAGRDNVVSDTLLTAADSAVYQSKAAGRGRSSGVVVDEDR